QPKPIYKYIYKPDQPALPSTNNHNYRASVPYIYLWTDFIRESELLVAKLETAPTLNALEAYVQQLKQAKQQLCECTDSTSALSTWTAIRPTLQHTITQISEAQRKVQTAIQRYGRVLDKQFRTDLTGIHVHENFPGEPEWLHYTIGMHLVREAAFGMAETFME
ncbi:unnamed protein product, partial [Pneumocystis jirovecii]